jgi:5'-nucleotidase
MYFSDNFEKIRNSRGLKGYWLTADHHDPDPSEDSDSVAVREGYVSVTPLHSEQTNFKFIDELSAWNLN